MTDQPPAVDNRPRCHNCGKVLAELLTPPWEIKCGRCKTVNRAEFAVDRTRDRPEPKQV